MSRGEVNHRANENCCSTGATADIVLCSVWSCRIELFGLICGVAKSVFRFFAGVYFLDGNFMGAFFDDFR